MRSKTENQGDHSRSSLRTTTFEQTLAPGPIIQKVRQDLETALNGMQKIDEGPDHELSAELRSCNVSFFEKLAK
jgi:hypothetical protein